MRAGDEQPKKDSLADEIARGFGAHLRNRAEKDITDSIIEIAEKELGVYLSNQVKAIPAISKWRDMVSHTMKERPRFPGKRKCSARKWWDDHYKSDAEAGLITTTDIMASDPGLATALRREGVPLSDLISEGTEAAAAGAAILNASVDHTKKFLSRVGRSTAVGRKPNEPGF